MNTVFEYKGYIGSAEVDVDGGVLFGKLLYIRDTISYTGTSVEELQAAFRTAVDDYLAACAEFGDEPDQPLKGSFNVRVGPERHRKLAIEARRRDMGLNEFMCWTLDYVLERRTGPVTPVSWGDAAGVVTNSPNWGRAAGTLVVLYEDLQQRIEGSTATSTALTISTSPGMQ